VDSFFHIFKDACGEDWYSEKGFLHVIIQKTKKKRISIINTHLNAASVFFMEKKAEKIRMKQVFDILSYLHQSSSQYLGIICGDFNEYYLVEANTVEP
jgi:endonuclease/exonuclease/phosphatase family metal-dependent hydrolase